MINVLHISTAMTWRGGERQISFLMQGFKEKNVNQLLICPKDSALEKYCQNHQFDYYSFPKKGGVSFLWAKKIKSICQDKHITHIHAHDSKAHTYLILTSLFYKLPKTFVSRRVIFPIKKNWLSRFKYENKNISSIICISKSVENVVKSSVSKARTDVIYSAINLAHNYTTPTYNLSENHPASKGHIKIGYVAALTFEKDHLTFIKAAQKVLKEKPDTFFFIIGEGNERQNIQQYIAKNDLNKRIILTGFISDVQNTIKQLDLLLFTSTSEGLGSSILDFFKAKIPVVTTACGGVEEIVLHNKTGLLSPVKNYESLSKQVLFLLDNPNTAKQLTDNAYELLKNKHNQKKYVDDTLKLYKTFTFKSDNKLTAIIPTYNEEKHIERAIKSVLFADEIIIIDSFSNDKTIEIANQFPVKVYQRPFDNFSAQKNYALGLASHDWILFLDADEELPVKLQRSIPQILCNNLTHLAYIFKLDYYFQNHLMKFGGFQSKKVIRLFNKQHCAFNGNFVHEKPIINGSVGKITTPINHHDLYGLSHFINKQNHYAKLKAKQQFSLNKNNIWLWLIIKSIYRFMFHYVIRLGFLDGKAGYTFAKIQAQSVMMRYRHLKHLKKLQPDLKNALNQLNKQGVILYPTDTVWGIGCDATDEKTIKKIYELKQRKASKSMIVLVDSIEMLEQYVEQISPKVLNILSEKNTPTSIIYSNPKGLAPNVLADDDTVAIRLVNDDFCQMLIQQFGKPIVSTSANVSGKPTPTTFSDISDNIKNGVDYVVKWRQNDASEKTASRIVKVNIDGSIEYLR